MRALLIAGLSRSTKLEDSWLERAGQRALFGAFVRDWKGPSRATKTGTAAPEGEHRRRFGIVYGAGQMRILARV